MSAVAAPTDVRAHGWLLGGRIDLRWTNPPASTLPPGQMQTGVRVVRRERAYPLGPDDGAVVYDGAVVDRLVDDRLVPGVRYYYTIFAQVGSGYVTSTRARGHALATGYPDLPETLFGMLPAVHQRYDRPLRPDEVTALPAEVAAALAALPEHLRSAGPLRRFTEAVFAPVAYARSTAEALRQLRDVEHAPPEYLAATASLLDVALDHSLPLQQQRAQLRFAARLRRGTGTVPHLRATVRRTTRWQVRVAESHQHIAREGGAPAGNLFARRPASPWWTAAGDLATELGFADDNSTATGTGATPATLIGTEIGPFALTPGASLSVAVDGMLPVTMRIRSGDVADLSSVATADMATLIGAALPEVTALARADGRLELRAPRPVSGSTLSVARSDATLVSLEGAPHGRLAVADFGPRLGVRVAHATWRPRHRPAHVVCRALRAGAWRPSFPLFGPTADRRADPALVPLPPSAPGQPPRALVVWVQDPGTAAARLRWAEGTLRHPRPAVLTGERAGPFPVADGSWLVLRDGAGRRRAARLVAADFAVPSAPTATDVVAALAVRLDGFAQVDVAPGNRIRLTSPTDGDDALLAVDRTASTAALALGLDGLAPARGDWADAIDWGPARDVDVVAAGRLAGPSATVDPSGRVVVAYSRHDGGRWAVRVVHWSAGAWSDDEALSDPGARAATAPTVTVDGAGRTWVAWQARRADGAGWELRRRRRDDAASAWGDETDLVAAGPGPLGDVEPALQTTSGDTPTVVFSSDRGGGRHIWSVDVAEPADTPRQLTGDLGHDTWPVFVPGPGGPLLVHRSDRSVALATAGSRSGEDTGTLRRYAGTTAAVPGDLVRHQARGAWDDHGAYTPHRPEGATPRDPLRDDEIYTRGSVRLVLTQVASGPLDAATAERLRTVLARVVPANVRVHIELAPEVAIEHAYKPDADLTDAFTDAHPFVEYPGAVAESTAVTTGTTTLRSATPSDPPPDPPDAGGTTADAGDLTSLRHRSWSRPPT